MKKTLLSLTLLCGIGCTSPHNYDDPIDPSEVTSTQLEQHADYVEQHYQKYNQAEGIAWQRYRSDPALSEPDFYGSGGDSCIFTGHKLAIDVYRYCTTGNGLDLKRVEQSLRGLYILTHITGTPGAICRNAFPAHRASEWGYPRHWSHRDQRFIHTGASNIPDPFSGRNFPAMTYYTRATKDQLSGLIYGLSVAWRYLAVPGHMRNPAQHQRIQELRMIVARISEDVYNHLRLYDWKIRDENGLNDTSADSVKGLIKTMVTALYRRTATVTAPQRVARIEKHYLDGFNSAFRDPSAWFHRFTNYQQYYAWNLRYLRAYSIYILEYGSSDKEAADRIDTIRDYVENQLWYFTKGHYNSKFIYLRNAIMRKADHLDQAYLALQSLSLRPLRSQDSPLAGNERKPSLLQVLFGDWDRFVILPHLRKSTSFSTWQKEPWDPGHPNQRGIEETTGICYLTAYWLRRFYRY